MSDPDTRVPPTTFDLAQLHAYLSPYAASTPDAPTPSVAVATSLVAKSDVRLKAALLTTERKKLVKTKCRKCDKNEIFNYLCLAHFHERFTLEWDGFGESDPRQPITAPSLATVLRLGPLRDYFRQFLVATGAPLPTLMALNFWVAAERFATFAATPATQAPLHYHAAQVRQAAHAVVDEYIRPIFSADPVPCLYLPEQTSLHLINVVHLYREAKPDPRPWVLNPEPPPVRL
jgi:hypothetical protein